MYEAWFGHPRHIPVGYDSDDPSVIHRQIQQAKGLGISAFVVDWFGDREPLIDHNYGLMQKLAAKEKFQVAMLYEEPTPAAGSTETVIADLTMFHDTYLLKKSRGHDAYLTMNGRPVIFIFLNGGHTNWDQVRSAVNQWDSAPLLIAENLPGRDANDFDGFYPWINPGPKGWAANGSNWGEEYLSNFYRTLVAKYPDKMIVGGAWAAFDDSKAAWGQNRHIAARCGETFRNTYNDWKAFVPAGETIPFVMIETWNDYEEGSAIEAGLPTCGNQPPPASLSSEVENVQASAAGRQ